MPKFASGKNSKPPSMNCGFTSSAIIIKIAPTMMVMPEPIIGKELCFTMSLDYDSHTLPSVCYFE